MVAFTRVFMLFLVLGSSAGATDITIRLQQGAGLFNTIYAGGDDAYVRQAYPDAATGKFGEMQAGWESYGGGGIVRSLIRYDLSSLKSGFGTATAIGAVRLKVYLIGTSGAAFTGKSVQLYRISAANKGWVGGTLATRTTAQVGAACWNYRLYDNTGYPVGDPRAGQFRHEPWAGYFSADSAKGCGRSSTDYVATAVASATINSADAATGMWVTFTFNDISFLVDWINNASNNAGFLIRSADLEAGTMTSYNTLRFASSEYPTATSRPILEIDATGFEVGNFGAIAYSLPAAGLVSAHISDIAGTMVREILFKADRAAGNNLEFWDCKRDPYRKSDTANLVVPDGRYITKILSTPAGLSAEYLLTLGTTAPITEGWPGNHVPVCGIALDDSNIYAAPGTNENPVHLVKMKFDGTRVWSQPGLFNFDGHIALGISGDTLFGCEKGGRIKVLKTQTIVTAPTTWGVSTGDPGSSISIEQDLFYDMAAYKGKIVQSVKLANKIRWINRANGAKVDSASVPNVKGVAIDTSGNALVISGNEVRRYTQGGGATYTVVIPSSSLISPYRLDVNKRNGDIYVACIGTSQQVKRFSAAGVLLQTYGQSGGRPVQGIYNAAIGFRTITDIAVAGDGSFWITEAYSPPKRLSHFALNGSLINEWYGGQQYANHASANPADPTDVWMDGDAYWTGPERNEATGNQLIRATVDYVHKTWTVRGTYQFNDTNANQSLNLIGNHIHEAKNWFVKNINGRIYLARDQLPEVLYFDSTADRLKPLSAAGSNWTHDLPATLNPPGGMYSWSWYDQNGNGTWSASEITVTNITGNLWDKCENSGWNMSVDDSLTYRGTYILDGEENDIGNGTGNSPRILAPTFTTVNGVPTPAFNWSARNHTFYADVPHIKWPKLQTTGFDQASRSTYGCYNVECSGGIFGSTESFGIGPGATIGGNRIAKWDSTGKLLWAVGRHAAGGIPNAGEILQIQRVMGTAHGCLVVSDLRNYQYVYDKDGLYVGRCLEKPYAGQENLPAGTWKLCDEQFGGTLFEVKNNNTPGLSSGDVLLFGGGDNSTPVYRIHGFDNWVRITDTITVQSGKITGSSIGIVPQSAWGRPASVSMNVIAQAHNPIVRFTMQNKADVSIELFTVQGSRVATLFDGSADAGNHVTTIERSAISSQYYLIRMKTGRTIITRPLMMVR